MTDPNRVRPESRGRTWRIVALLAVCVAAQPAPAPRNAGAADDAASPTFTLHFRRRVETKPESGRFHALTETVEWDARKTAVILCDMWDKHWCQGATRRVGEMA